MDGGMEFKNKKVNDFEFFISLEKYCFLKKQCSETV